MEVVADLNRISACAALEEAEQRLAEFEARWEKDYPPVGQLWRATWPRLIPFSDDPSEIRKVRHDRRKSPWDTTNALASLNMSSRKLAKHDGVFPRDEALVKLLYPALRNISKKWTMSIGDWKAALSRFTIQFEERLPQQ